MKMNMDMGYEINECARRKRNRLKNYDYSQSGWYFITICVKNREQFFGEVQDGKMSLNEYGKIAENQWLWLGEQYDYVRLDTYIVMPDHLHGILIIENDINRRDNPRIVPTGIVPNNNDCAISINNRHHNLLSKTISAFKTTSSKLIHQAGLERFIWQRSFYDHIIRNEETLNKIREYIINNPLEWTLDLSDQYENLF